MRKPTKIKTVTAKVEERTAYIAHSKCPSCKASNEIEPEEDGVTITETCWKCRKEYKIKIPKNALH